MNNGIQQAGQQWGNDHAPEIDPFVANHLSVVKGAAALEYGGSNLGSVILVEPGNISDDPHLHGQVNYLYNSNGKGHNLNTQFQQKLKSIAWKLTTTLKDQGDSRSPEYFLRNTGKREANAALQLEKQWNSKWSSSLYYSMFNTTIGILRGAHIGNITDLNIALSRTEPFFTEENFSREIDAPRQEVNHHLLKFESKLLLAENKVLKFTFAGQLNNRKEFDVRRGGRTDRAALSLNQWAQTMEVKYSQETSNHLLFKTGAQFNWKDNTNEFGTGVTPLIPDFRKWSLGGYAIIQKDLDKLLLELGGRFELQDLLAFPQSGTIPPVILREERNFNNFSVSGGLKYRISDALSLNLNTGLSQRSPEVNELFSNGLHQGVGGLERGSSTLSPEKSIKSILSLDYKWSNKVILNILGYHQQVKDFIFLEPQQEFELTIRGAFPVFIYKQTKARIYGLDANLQIEPTAHWRFNLKYAYIKGQDLERNIGLVNIPGNNANIALSYFSGGKDNRVKNFFLNGELKYQAQQNDITEMQDFALPPEAYFLLNFKTGFDFRIRKNELKFPVAVKNILNTEYRDYLNRLRYFANDSGRDIIFRLNYSF